MWTALFPGPTANLDGVAVPRNTRPHSVPDTGPLNWTAQGIVNWYASVRIWICERVRVHTSKARIRLRRPRPLERHSVTLLGTIHVERRVTIWFTQKERTFTMVTPTNGTAAPHGVRELRHVE